MVSLPAGSGNLNIRTSSTSVLPLQLGLRVASCIHLLFFEFSFRVCAMKCSCHVWLSIACLLLAGCGGAAKPKVPVYKASGKVLFNGQPVVGADVTFICAEANKSAFGRTNEEGIFKLTTYSANDGAVEGQHKVAIVQIPPSEAPKELAPTDSDAYVPPEQDQSTAPVKVESVLPLKFGDANTSGLTAEVKKDGDNEFEFNLP